MERDLIKEVNELRKNPAGYAQKLVKSKGYFKKEQHQGKFVWKHPDAERGLLTEEGPAAYDEAINFLKKAKPVGALTASKGLNKIAAEFLLEYQKDPEANVEFDSVVEKFGKFEGQIKRQVEFGSPTAERVVVSLVVCDGDKSRGQREVLLSKDLKQIGVAHGSHDTFRQCSVLVYCEKFENTVDGDDKAF